MDTKIIDDMSDPEFRKLLAQEELILEVTEVLCGLLEQENISKKELADRLGKTKGFISQLLNGGRNLTLRTVADILHVLGYKVSLTPQRLRQRNVVEFPTCQTIHKAQQGPIYRHRNELKATFADNYSGNKTALV